MRTTADPDPLRALTTHSRRTRSLCPRSSAGTGVYTHIRLRNRRRRRWQRPRTPRLCRRSRRSPSQRRRPRHPTSRGGRPRIRRSCPGLQLSGPGQGLEGRTHRRPPRRPQRRHRPEGAPRSAAHGATGAADLARAVAGREGLRRPGPSPPPRCRHSRDPMWWARRRPPRATGRGEHRPRRPRHVGEQKSYVVQVNFRDGRGDLLDSVGHDRRRRVDVLPGRHGPQQPHTDRTVDSFTPRAIRSGGAIRFRSGWSAVPLNPAFEARATTDLALGGTARKAPSAFSRCRCRVAESRE